MGKTPNDPNKPPKNPKPPRDPKDPQNLTSRPKPKEPQGNPGSSQGPSNPSPGVPAGDSKSPSESSSGSPSVPSPSGTLLPSFRTALPDYGAKPPPIDIKASGHSTKGTDAPVFWVNSETEWVQRGHKVIKNNSEQLNRLKGESIPAREDSLSLETEADVRHGAYLYLLHPINQVMSALRPGTKATSEKIGNNIRTDISYKLGDSTFAIIEFKRRGAIVWEEFEEAHKEINVKNKKELVSINSKAPSDEEIGRTYFADNSVWLMKQAANYAQTEGTDYVALFDWDHLVLIKFSVEN